MDALDSPLEALALNYLTYGFLTVVNNMWAWVAVITAAVSFWRIRAISSPAIRGGCQDAAASSTSSNAAATAEMEEDISSSAAGETVQLFSSAHTNKIFGRILERERSTKTKFSLYYEDEAEHYREDGGDDCDDNRNEMPAAEMTSEKLDYNFRPRRCDEWERMTVVTRMGDMGWYRWQDRTVLDGSVVRLWEGRRRCRHAAALPVVGGNVWY